MPEKVGALTPLGVKSGKYNRTPIFGGGGVKILTGKISFQIFTKKFRWKQQITSSIGDSIESEVFDELMLLELKTTITKLLEKIDGLLGKIIDRADEHDR